MPETDHNRAAAKHFYKGKRQGDKVRNQYVGPVSEPVVRILRREDALRKAEKRARRVIREEETAAHEAIETKLSQAERQFQNELNQWLQKIGYRKDRSGK